MRFRTDDGIKEVVGNGFVGAASKAQVLLPQLLPLLLHTAGHEHCSSADAIWDGR